MFGKTMVRGLLATALVAATMCAGEATAQVILPKGLPPGSEYQLAFVTDGVTTGESALPSYYNTFVQQQASALDGIVPGDTTWDAIVA